MNFYVRKKLLGVGGRFLILVSEDSETLLCNKDLGKVNDFWTDPKMIWFFLVTKLPEIEE